MKGVLSFVTGVIGWAAANLGLLSFLHAPILHVITALSGVLTVLGVYHATSDNPFTALIDKLGRGWKTILGTIVALIAYLTGPDVAGTLSAGLSHVVVTLASILAAVGLYHKQAVGSNP